MGLIEKGDSAVDAASRELQEETGYHGDTTTTFESPKLCMSPGLSNETITIVVARVDLDDPKMPFRNDTVMRENNECVACAFDLGMKEMMKTKGMMPISLLYCSFWEWKWVSRMSKSST